MEFSHAFDIGRNLQHGIECLKRAGLPLFIGALLMQCSEGGGGGGGGNNFQLPSDFGSEDGGSSYDPDILLTPLLQSGNPFADLPGGDLGALGLGIGVIIAIVIVGLICGLLMFAFNSWLHGGYLRLHASTLETGIGTFPTLFSGSDLFLSMMLGKFLKGLILFGVFLASVIPGAALLIPGIIQKSPALMMGGGGIMFLFFIPLIIYFSLGLAFVEHAIVFDRLSATEAISRSFELARGNRLGLFLFFLVYAILIFVAAIVGLLMLCIGALFTIPLARAATDVAFTEGYLLLTRPHEETEHWTIWDTSPAR